MKSGTAAQPAPKESQGQLSTPVEAWHCCCTMQPGWDAHAVCPYTLCRCSHPACRCAGSHLAVCGQRRIKRQGCITFASQIWQRVPP